MSDISRPSRAARNAVSFDHLQSELARIDLLVRRAVLRWQLAGQNPADVLRGLSISADEANALLAHSLGTNWGQTVPEDHPQLLPFVEALDQAAQRSQALIDLAWQQGQTPCLEQLAFTFGLDDFDFDTLLICLAPLLDLRYERLYGFLQDDVTRRRPTVNLVLDLLCESGPQRLLMLSHLADDAPLLRHGLIERVEAAEGKAPLLGQMLALDETMARWLLGQYCPHADLSGSAVLSWPTVTEVDDVLLALARPTLERAAMIEDVVAVFYGPDQACQRAGAALMAACVNRPLLRVDLAAVVSAGVPPLRALKWALRDARLTEAVPCLAGWEACWAADGAPRAALQSELLEFPGPIILAARAAWRPQDVERERPIMHIEFPIPDFAQRRALWQHFLGESLSGLESAQVAGLAGQFLLTASQIRDAVASARDEALEHAAPLQERDLFVAARLHSNPSLSGLARKITPRYTWHDIVLPADQLSILREIVDTVRGRPLVLGEWGVGRKLASSHGVTILFAGPPGTGKTMAAEVIAADLGLDLYKIDLSTIISKYIGETEKNLERIFSEAENSNAILFFDEADALFGKRSEVRDSHDRYANIEISYLLQRMEAYNGVTILATNLRANLDDAFTRRLQFAVEFPFPGEADQVRIWQTLFPAVPREDQLDLPRLAQSYNLAGGNIRNVLINAAYLAAADGKRITMDHLLHSVRRELQKMGRLTDTNNL